MKDWADRLSNPLMSADRKLSACPPSKEIILLRNAGAFFCRSDILPLSSDLLWLPSLHLEDLMEQSWEKTLAVIVVRAYIRCNHFPTSFQKSLFVPLQIPGESPVKLWHLLFHSGSLGMENWLVSSSFHTSPPFLTFCSNPNLLTKASTGLDLNPLEVAHFHFQLASFCSSFPGKTKPSGKKWPSSARSTTSSSSSCRRYWE